MVKTVQLCLVVVCLSVSAAYTQVTDFAGYKIFVNPGHGGYDSNDRHMLTTDFWESEGNLVKGLYLRDLLKNLNATVYMSRTTNSTADDLALSVIDEMANAANADFFLSIHSNGWDGSQNQPLMLFRGYDNEPVFADAKKMADIMWQKIYEKGNCWTNTNKYVKGDWTYYPQWGAGVGLGVLRTLTMPGVLCEGSFHDYVPESWRLRNTNYLHHEAWAFLRSFIEFYNAPPVNSGVIAGVVRDSLQTPTWYFKPGTMDEKLPLNGVKVTLTPGNRICTVDTLNNGFFYFDSVSPGEYKLYFEGLADYFNDSLQVTVAPNKTTLADFYLQYDTTKTPELISLKPDLTDSVPFNQEFTFTFSMPMNADSVQKAIRFIPQVQLSYTWDSDMKELKVKPLTSFWSKTQYTAHITNTACSKWKVKIAAEQQYSFVTFYRSHLNIEKAYPSDTLKDVTLYPQIRIYFDAPINESSASSEIRLLNDVGQPLPKVREKFNTSAGKGAYFFEADQPLALNKKYTVSLGAGLSDIGGYTLNKSYALSFTTRATNYTAGNVIEAFETISNFWDPETSGSTVGTDNPRTTFTASTDVKLFGSYAGQLNYVFTNAHNGLCRVYNIVEPSIGSDANSVFGTWVFGDLSFNTLEYWFYSSGVNKTVIVDQIDWAGWDFKTIPFNAIGATGQALFHSIALAQTDTGSLSGTLWFDNAMVYIPTGIQDIEAETATMQLYPNPLTDQGIVRFRLTGNSKVSVNVYNLDGRKVEHIITAELYPGVQEIPWIPSAELASGVYIIRVEIKPIRGGSCVTHTGRWVLVR